MRLLAESDESAMIQVSTSPPTVQVVQGVGTPCPLHELASESSSSRETALPAEQVRQRPVRAAGPNSGQGGRLGETLEPSAAYGGRCGHF